MSAVDRQSSQQSADSQTPAQSVGIFRHLNGRLLWPLLVLLGLLLITTFLSRDYKIATTLGIVQGLGEFLPISSSAHLIVVPWFFGWNSRGAFYNSQSYDVALHVGTLMALLVFFWKDWVDLLSNAHRPQTTNGRMFWLLVLATVPGAVIGFALDHYAQGLFRERYLVIAAALAVMGVILYLVDTKVRQTDTLRSIMWNKALVIGFAQALAFIPGVSRSGATMTMGRALGLDRETAARFSFLMAVPVTAGAALLKMSELDSSVFSYIPFWLGIAASFVVGMLSIGFLLRYLRANTFLPFVVYRIALALLIVVVYLTR